MAKTTCMFLYKNIDIYLIFVNNIYLFIILILLNYEGIIIIMYLHNVNFYLLHVDVQSLLLIFIIKIIEVNI